MLGLDVEATVGPVAVDGDLAVLRVEVEATSGSTSVMVGEVFPNRALTQDDSFDGARLVDLDAGVEWWWAIPISPLATWFAGSLAFAALIVMLLSRRVR